MTESVLDLGEKDVRDVNAILQGRALLQQAAQFAILQESTPSLPGSRIQ